MLRVSSIEGCNRKSHWLLAPCTAYSLFRRCGMNYYRKLWGWNKRSIDCSIAIIIGALSATLARAFRTPYTFPVTPSFTETSTNRLGVHVRVRGRLSGSGPFSKSYRVPIEVDVFSMRTGSLDVFTDVSHTLTSWGLGLNGGKHLVLLHQNRPGYRYSQRRACNPAARCLALTDWSLPATVERGIEFVGLELTEVVRRVQRVDGERRAVIPGLEVDSSRLDEPLPTSISASVGSLAGPMKRRKPPTYWAKKENVRREIVLFWAKLGMESDKVRI